MKYELTAVLAIATFAIMMTSATSAYGQAQPNVHAVDPIPLGGTPNTLFAMQSVSTPDAGASPTVEIYLARAFVLYDPDIGTPIPTNPNTCQNFNPPAGDRMWVLRNTDNQLPIAASHDAISVAGSQIYFDQNVGTGPSGAVGDGFGNGAVAANPDVVGTASLYNLNADPTKNNWVEINSAGNVIAGNFDNTAQPGQYIFVVCGWVDTDANDGQWAGPGLEVISIEARGFLIDQVGGEMMPLSATSLLVAGASANALWILPILGLVGTVIAIRKLEA